MIFRPGTAESLNEQAFGNDFASGRSFWVRWFEVWKNRRYLANLRRAGIRGGRLLEVGVGSGSFLQAARDAGFEVEGCDLSESLCRRVQQKTGIHVHNVLLDDLPSGHWDVVAMHHVLEHVSDPVSFLSAVRRRLRPGGVVHLAVPNVDCWEALLRGWNSYEPYHVIYFNSRTLTGAFQSAGLRVLRSWTFEPFSVWTLAVLRTLRPPRRGLAAGSLALASTPGVTEHVYRMALVFTGVITSPLRWIQSRLGRGDELLLLAVREI